MHHSISSVFGMGHWTVDSGHKPTMRLCVYRLRLGADGRPSRYTVHTVPSHHDSPAPKLPPRTDLDRVLLTETGRQALEGLGSRLRASPDDKPSKLDRTLNPDQTIIEPVGYRRTARLIECICQRDAGTS